MIGPLLVTLHGFASAIWEPPCYHGKSGVRMDVPELASPPCLMFFCGSGFLFLSVLRDLFGFFSAPWFLVLRALRDHGGGDAHDVEGDHLPPPRFEAALLGSEDRRERTHGHDGTPCGGHRVVVHLVVRVELIEDPIVHDHRQGEDEAEDGATGRVAGT